MSIEQMLKDSWNKDYELKWEEKSQLSRAEFQIPEHQRIIVIHNSIREDYEKKKKSEAEERQNKQRICCLDDEVNVKNNSVPYGSLFFRISLFPALRFHLFAQPLEHRDYPLASDHKTVMDFVSETNFAIYQNLKGSGAGIPDHVHYQGHLRENFPLLTDSLHEPLPEKTNEFFDVSYPQMLVFGVLFKMKNEKAKEKVSYLIEEVGKEINKQGIAYNLMFDKNKVFLFPRTREIVKNLPYELKGSGIDQWQIGGQEMGNLFNSKYLSVFQRLSWNVLNYVLRETTVTDKTQQKYLKELVHRRIR
ncbi:MAG: DUF4922 domain-containing protein [Candidatus Pacearchaeota archaeon]|jgi:hypothetical protein